METIINFLEEYWGVALLGGTTVGTLVTFVVVQIKMFARNKIKDIQLGSAERTVLSVTEDVKRLIGRVKELEEEKQMYINRNLYTDKVIASVFETLSYLAMESKMGVDVKKKVLETFTRIGDMPAKHMDLEERDVEEESKVLEASVKEAISKSTSLLEQYTKKEQV